MASKTDFMAKGIHWELKYLYTSFDDPKITNDKEVLSSKILNLNSRYKKILLDGSISSNDFYSLLKEYESSWQIVSRIEGYASLIYSIDTISEEIGKFFQQSIELEASTQSQLLWVELGIVGLSDERFKDLLKNKAVKLYLPYLNQVRVFKSFTLSEKEEVALSKKEVTGRQAFVRLFDQFDSSVRYELEIKGEKKSLNYSEIIPYLTAHHDRGIRKMAADSMSKSHEQHSMMYTFLINTLLNDKKINDELRGYKAPQEATFLNYKVEPEIVAQMTSAIEKGYTLSEKFYKIKSEVMKISDLQEWDRYVLPYSSSSKKYSWDEACEIVISSFESFSPEFAKIAKMFVDNKWIHAEMLPSKRSGAYCSYIDTTIHPYVLVNFAGEIRDVTTLAHELGHGIHGYLARNNPFLQAWPSTTIAEIASIFAESIVFEAIYSKETDKKVKANLLTEKIQSIFASIFRQNAFYLFESDIHEHRRTKGELTTEELNSYFQNRLQDMFGIGLTLSPGHANWWMSILHFYHYNFYVFSYAFGEMLSLSLYGKYKKDGGNMVSDYINALSRGGTVSPLEATKIMGIDIKEKGFWENGLKIIDSYIEEFLRLTK